MMRKDIRQIELEIENAARDLRKARDQVKYAKDKLSELDDRHWAILSLYNPARAEEGVAEALRELAENEPAARLQNREKNASEGTSSNNPQNKQT